MSIWVVFVFKDDDNLSESLRFYYYDNVIFISIYVHIAVMSINFMTSIGFSYVKMFTEI